MMSRSYFGFSMVAWKAFSLSVGTYRFSLATSHLLVLCCCPDCQCNTLHDKLWYCNNMNSARQKASTAGPDRRRQQRAHPHGTAHRGGCTWPSRPCWPSARLSTWPDPRRHQPAVHRALRDQARLRGLHPAAAARPQRPVTPACHVRASASGAVAMRPCRQGCDRRCDRVRLRCARRPANGGTGRARSAARSKSGYSRARRRKRVRMRYKVACPWFGPGVRLLEEHSFGTDLSDAGPSDVAVVFDFHRYRRQVAGAARAFSEAGVSVIGAITDSPLSPLVEWPIPGARSRFRLIGPFDSSVPVVAMCELTGCPGRERTSGRRDQSNRSHRGALGGNRRLFL